MKKKLKYDPDDIESILLHKSFDELAEEEKEFVLHHVDSADEYESMRKTLIDILEQAPDKGLPEPPASIKTQLMHEFANEKKGSFSVWLNSLFAMPSTPWYKQRGFGYSLALAGMSAGIIAILVLPGAAPDIAQVQEKEVSKETITSPDEKTAVIKDESAVQQTQNGSQSPEGEIKSVDGAFAEKPLNEPVEVEENFNSYSTDDVVVEDIKSNSKSLSEDETDASMPAAPAPASMAESSGYVVKDELYNIDMTTGNASSPTTLESIDIASKKDKLKVFTIEEKSKSSIKASEKKDLLDILYTAL